MKKVLTMIATMFILLSVSIISNATLELTEDNLSALLDEVCGYKKMVEVTSEDGKQTSSTTVDFEGVTYEIDTNQDTITLKMEEETINGEIVIKYDLNNAKKPKFTYNLAYTKGMTLEEFENEAGKGLLTQQIIFSTVGKSEEILPEDTFGYLMENEFGTLLWNFIDIESTYTDGVTSAKEFYNEKMNLTNEFFEFKYEKESETEEEYHLKATLEIKETADFSKLEGYVAKSLKEGFEDNSTNKDESIPSNKISDSLENKNDNQGENVVANIQKIPQTGNEINLKNVLNSVIILAIFLGICLTIYNKKH